MKDIYPGHPGREKPTQDGSTIYSSPMNALYGLFAAPTAATAIEAVSGAINAATTPFDALLKAAMSANESSAVGNEAKSDADDNEPLQDRVARQLQGLLGSLGIAAGEHVRLHVDSASGEVSVADEHSLAAAIEEGLNNNEQLEADIRRLAEINGLFGHAPFANDSELEIELSEDQDAALLAWR
jgi:hypothetical protein